jgi:hypothetical protein
MRFPPCAMAPCCLILSFFAQQGLPFHRSHKVFCTRMITWASMPGLCTLHCSFLSCKLTEQVSCKSTACIFSHCLQVAMASHWRDATVGYGVCMSTTGMGVNTGTDPDVPRILPALH